MNLIRSEDLHEVRAIWVFRGVALAGGFRKGATALGLSQPAVSAAIGRLEEELGLELFIRHGRTNVLSPAGKALLEVAGPALNDWARIEGRVREALEGRPRGSLRVGSGESSLLYLLPSAVRTYRRQYPEVKLSLVSQPYEESLSRLRDGSLDLAVRSLKGTTPDITATPVRNVRRVLITSRKTGPKLERRPTVAELAKLPFVLPHRGSTTRAALEGALARGGYNTFNIALEAGGWEAVKLYVGQGVGVGLVPEIVVTLGDRRRLATIPVGHLFPSERYGVLQAAGRPLSMAAQAMLETLRDQGATR
jgi:LysR family cys regulon transcriptional activator